MPICRISDTTDICQPEQEEELPVGMGKLLYTGGGEGESASDTQASTDQRPMGLQGK